MKIRKLLLIGFCSLSVTACSTLADSGDTGVVIARSAQVRSSTAVVAADLVEVVRGDQVEILSSTEGDDRERWYRVRVGNTEGTEGWVEARNIMPEEAWRSSQQLAEADKDVPAQAAGQLRANTNLRLTPDRNSDDNILFKLESGSRFEIVGWKRVAQPKTSGGAESDDAPRPGTGNRSANKGTADTAMEPEATETWYRVRLARSASPAPAGWLYGKQVELTVPSDIIFYRTGREFVAWQRLDGDSNNSLEVKEGDDVRPGSWVILEKSSAPNRQGIDDPDFDRVFVLGYNRETKEHYTAYRSPDLKGMLPLRLQTEGANKTFTVRVQTKSGEQEVRFGVNRDDRGMLRIKPQTDLSALK